MDCRGWGSSGWKLLHTLALLYDKSKECETREEKEGDKEGDKEEKEENKKEVKKTLSIFLKNVQYVLPCIFCRRSYRKYIKEFPLNPFLESHNLFEWVYHIHNKVNDKLREQGYKIEKNPSLQSVKREWEQKNIFRQQISSSFAGGWDFLYCVVLNFPVNSEDLSERRLAGHLQFFYSLGKLFDGKHMFSKKMLRDAMKTRDSFTKWLYTIECKKKGKKGKKSKKSKGYKSRCKRFERHRVEKCTGETCRNKK